jgi:signal peptidase I
MRDPVVDLTLASVETTRRLGRLLGTACLSVVVVIAVAMVSGAAVTSSGGTIFGYRVSVVTSGSMSPTLRTGDLVVTSKVTPAQAVHLHAGQVIMFDADTSATARPLIFTHRIVSSSPLGYTTKGDANNAPDFNTVRPAAVLGLYDTRIPFGGYVVSYIHTRLGLASLVLLVLLPVILGELRRRWTSTVSSPSPAEAAY